MWALDFFAFGIHCSLFEARDSILSHYKAMTNSTEWKNRFQGTYFLVECGFELMAGTYMLYKIKSTFRRSIILFPLAIKQRLLELGHFLSYHMPSSPSTNPACGDSCCYLRHNVALCSCLSQR